MAYDRIERNLSLYPKACEEIGQMNQPAEQTPAAAIDPVEIGGPR